MDTTPGSSLPQVNAPKTRVVSIYLSILTRVEIALRYRVRFPLHIYLPPLVCTDKRVRATQALWVATKRRWRLPATRF